MKLSHKIFISYTALLLALFFLIFSQVSKELEPLEKQLMEESMLETANLLAETIQQNLGPGNSIHKEDLEFFDALFKDFKKRKLYVKGANKIWSADLVDIQSFSK